MIRWQVVRLELRTAFVALAMLTLASLRSTSPVGAAESDSTFPVRVSANNRYLEDASGKPFLLQGDTAWS